MADKVQVTIVSRESKLMATLSLDKEKRVSDLKSAFHQLRTFHSDPKYHPGRQWFTVGTTRGEPLKKDKMRLMELGETNLRLIFKDLGPQVSWKLVYVVEYLGPLLILPVMFYYPHLIWTRDTYPRTRSQL